MYITITDDKRFLNIRNLTMNEIQILRDNFTKEYEDSWRIKKMGPWAICKEEFFSKFGLLPFGLWMELIKIIKKYNLQAQFDPKVNECLQDTKLSYNIFKYYVDSLFKEATDNNGNPFAPKEYQLEGVFKLIKFRRCCVEVTTSGGKTLMSYIMFKFLYDIKHSKKCLYIVPNKGLVTQSKEKYDIYENNVHGEHKWKSAILYGGMKKNEKKEFESGNYDILFATYQSLANRKADFYKDFDVIFIDECHHSKANSYKNIIQKCINMKYCFGMTGTFPLEDTYNRFIIESYIGPLMYTLTAFQLINEEHFATPIVIVNEILDYATLDEKKALYVARKFKDKKDMSAGNRLLKQEIDFSVHNNLRFRYICDLASKCKHNTLILFNDVKEGEGYGHKIFDYLKENSDKRVFYADGGTKNEAREFYKSEMEKDLTGNTVFVGSTGCFSEGIDIGNLWTIILVNSVKSQYIVKQMIGRGMRRFPGKKQVVLFDIVDDLRYGNKGDEEWIKNNYLWKHHLEREKIYIREKFPVYNQKVAFGELSKYNLT